MSSMMQAQKEARLDQLRAEMSWELARHQLAHKKLHDRFLSPVQQNRFVVKAFLTNHQVAAMRFPVPSKESATFLAANLFYPLGKSVAWAKRARSVHTPKDGPLQGTEQGDESEVLPQLQSLPETPQQPETSRTMARSESMSSTRMKLQAALSKAEARNQIVEARKAEWNELLAAKPDEKFISPADAKVSLVSVACRGWPVH